MNILLTGGAGFIGFHLAKALLDKGDEVVIVDNFNDYYDPKLKHARIKALGRSENLKVIRADISKIKELEPIFIQNKFDKVVNLAAQAGVRYSLEDPIRYEIWNNLGFLNILELMKKHQVKDLVFASSSSVYGGNTKIPFSEKDNVDSPVSLYAATKKTNELYAHVYSHLYNFNCTGLRFFTVYGPWGRPDMALFKFAKLIKEGKSIDVYNNGKMERDFTYIDDIIAGVLKAIDKPFKYEIFNLGNNKPVLLSRFIEVIEKEMGMQAKKNPMPMQPGDVKKTYANIDKAKKMLKYNPKTSIEEGVKHFVEWFKNIG